MIRGTFVPGVHFEFFVPGFGQNFKKKSGNAHPSKKTVLSVKREVVMLSKPADFFFLELWGIAVLIRIVVAQITTELL